MAFRVVRQRKEARRNAKLEEIFQDRDKNQNAHITFEQVQEIFRIYEVEIDENTIKKYLDENEEISKPDFVKLATDLKLLDFDLMGDKTILPSLKSRKAPSTPSKRRSQQGGQGLLCCCGGDAEEDKPVDKIETAFRKLDIDGDGFLSWEEFQQLAVKMDPDQAERIFVACDQDLTGKISLEDFRMIATSKPPRTDDGVSEENLA
ncbi:uncharacterized protein LOC111702786 [Eurytemora carolleeae]|uniref:uncharacterized protein LOC111702786 n=1 Tax=Eurytemora carolleeae TaxID=1294199 RepID=UPI000C78867D|nr:uncharacterized protein LOC111702786 [Eurytemora carolleeae]|eukprot:XP_023330326.1 uncharacterized protein LOC111702786 [Eurytemora affinis]